MNALPIPFRRPQNVLAAFLCDPCSVLSLVDLFLRFASSGASSYLRRLCAIWWHPASQCWIIPLARSR